MTIRILVSDKFSEVGLDVLRDAKDVEVDYLPGLSHEELCEKISGYDGLLIRSATQVSADVLAKAARLKAVGRAGIGVDNVDVPAASVRGIVVMNTPTGNAVTTAEHALSLMLSAARKIPQATASMRAGQWEKNKFQGREIAGKTLGIIGLGNIGRIVADRAQGLRMRVIAFDPMISNEKAASLGVERVDLDALYARADFITIHTPKTPETAGMINKAVLAKMKDGVIIINAARGGIIHEGDLANAVQSGKVAAVGIDVFEQEPPEASHPLLKLENVICTPHLGASTSEAQERVAVQISEQMIDYIRNGTVHNAINVPAVSKELAEKLNPYIALARRMGLLLGQLEAIEVNRIQVRCWGEPGQHGLRPVAQTAVAGYLQAFLDEPTNAIGAPYQAKERGIRVSEVYEENASAGFANAIELTVQGEKGEHRAIGVLGAKGDARLVALDGYELEAMLEGSALLMINDDQPGVIGAVGSILGKHNTNIARMQLGLKAKGGQALSLWNLDNDINDATLEELRKIKNVRSVISVRL